MNSDAPDERSMAAAMSCYALSLYHRVDLMDFEVTNLFEIAAHFGAKPTPAMKSRLIAVAKDEVDRDQYVARLEKEIAHLRRPWYVRWFLSRA